MVDDATSVPASALTLQLLAWLSTDSRTYAEAIEAWRTSCPRLSVWEDAISDGFVQIVRTGGESRALPTARGTAVLGERSAPAGLE